MKKLLMALLILAGALSLSSCTAVKPYQKAYLNDTDMQLNTRASEVGENLFFSYREGSGGANGGKSGGGCGCN